MYNGNTASSTSSKISGTSGTTKSNRPITFGFDNSSDAITKLEVTRKINGVSTTCALLDEAGKVRFSLSDWPALTTEYSIKASTAPDGGVNERTFGPYAVTVEPAGNTVGGEASLYGSSVDSSGGGGGAFFQTRSYAIGFGGYTGPNFNSDLLKSNPRLADFGLLFTASTSELKVISPSATPESFMYPKLVNECGYQTTTFAPYTGTLNPKLAQLTLEEVAALPEPPATGTSLVLEVGISFVYRTSDGKKGLVRVDTLQTTPFPKAGLHFTAAQ